MRILYLSQSFPPEPGATIRPLRQAASLRRLGHDVTMITSIPFHPYGRTFPGYRWRLIRHEVIDGVPVLRVWSLPTPNRGVARRLLSYGTFAALSLFLGLLQPRPELIIASVPNPGTDLAGILLARLRRIRCVVELRDIITENLPQTGYSKDSFVTRMAALYMRIVYRLADLVAIPYEAMAELLREHGISDKRILLLPHAADPMPAADPETVKAIREPKGWNGWFVALYAGSLSRCYGLNALVDAARELKESATRIKIVLLGAGVERAHIEQIIQSEALDTLELAGHVPPAEVGSWLFAADVLMASMAITGYRGHYLYTKECEYLLSGKPIIALEDRPRLKPLLESIDAGVGVVHGDTRALVSALRWHADHPEKASRRGRNGREYAQQHLLRDDIVRAFERDLRQRLASYDRGISREVP